MDLIPKETIEQKIYLIRKQKVILDSDLAKLYGVGTKVLNQAVKRNAKRFPSDFMFTLTREEILRMSQIVTSLKYSKYGSFLVKLIILGLKVRDVYRNLLVCFRLRLARLSSSKSIFNKSVKNIILSFLVAYQSVTEETST